MTSQIPIAHTPGAARPVHHALGDGLRASLVEDPLGLVLIPLLLHFPYMVIEALRARFRTGLDVELMHSALVGPVLSLGLGFALAGLLLGQALVIRRTAGRLTPGPERGLGEEFEGVFARFPSFIVVFLLFWMAFLTGFVLFLLPGLLVLYLWGFSPQAAVLDPDGILSAFRRSRRSTVGQTGRWLWGAALAVAGLTVIAVGAALLWAGVAEAYGGDVPFGIYIVAFGLVELVTVVFTAVWTALYLDLEHTRLARAQAHAVPAIVPKPAEAESVAETFRAG
jgi:hypothetical protein